MSDIRPYQYMSVTLVLSFTNYEQGNTNLFLMFLMILSFLIVLEVVLEINGNLISFFSEGSCIKSLLKMYFK